MATSAKKRANDLPDSDEKKDVRLYARVAKKVKSTIEEAAELTGATTNQFMAQAAYDAARKVIERERVIRLNEDATTHFLNLLENPPEPNAELKSAVTAYKESSLNNAGH